MRRRAPRRSSNQHASAKAIIREQDLDTVEQGKGRKCMRPGIIESLRVR
jgi:hypothetical protein